MLFYRTHRGYQSQIGWRQLSLVFRDVPVERHLLGTDGAAQAGVSQPVE